MPDCDLDRSSAFCSQRPMPEGYQGQPLSSITLLSIFLLIGCGFRKLAVHGVECQAMAAEY